MQGVAAKSGRADTGPHCHRGGALGYTSCTPHRTGAETRGVTVTIHLDPARRSPVHLQIVAALVRGVAFRPGRQFAFDDVARRIGAALREVA